MATTTPIGPPITDHAAEATAWLKAYAGHPEDLAPSELFAYAQVHATLAVAQATERQTEAVEALAPLLENLESAVLLLDVPRPSWRFWGGR